MINNKDMSSQFSRMKDLMNYGLNEGKKQSYSGVEYTREGADHKMYGIVREGLKYYIKVAKDKNNLIAENFEYIGGFRNRKDHEYSSFASAQKNFDFKLRSLAEAYGGKDNIVIESWNPDKNEELNAQSYDKMKKEIMRERQIMENASKILGGKAQSLNECGADPFCENPDKEFKDAQKQNMKGEKPETGDPKKANKEYKETDLKNTDIKESKMNEEEVLGWNRSNPDYMDKSHGTEVGDDAPFDAATARNIDDGDKKVTSTGELKNGVVEEGESMHDKDNQNTPKPGVGEVGDNQPFDGEKGRQIDEAIDDFEGEADLEDGADDGLALDDAAEGEDLGDEEVLDGGDELGVEGDFEGGDDLDAEEDFKETDEDRMSAIEDMLTKIMDKLGISKYDDEPLYDDDAAEGEDYVADDGVDADEDFSDEDDENVYETKAYKAMKLRESKMQRVNEEGMKPFKDAGRVPSGNILPLKDFGKHPAYQKKVMSLPPKDIQEFPDYYDMNDESVRNDSPYGEKIGDGAPFDLDVDKITNSIAESIIRMFGKKK